MQRVFEDHPEMTTQLQDEALSVFDTFTDAFPTTAYEQNRIIQELFSPANPEEVVVSQQICWVKHGGSKVIAIRNKSFFNVPLIESLKQLISNSRIFTTFNTVRQRNREGFLYDFGEAALFKSHPLYSVRPNA